MKNKALIPHLFRTEYTKIVSVLCKTFGLTHIELAEDIVSESFLKAAETWKLKGVPDNPAAWLYTVAKNHARDHFRRERIFQDKIVSELVQRHRDTDELVIDFSDTNIKDSQLQMLFAVCNPIISNETQITLALRVLCGFGIDEIASALLSNKPTINKRLMRAKKTLRAHQINLAFPDKHELNDRLSNVLSVLYLLFNEGYFSSTNSQIISKDLCLEAMRLLYLLLNNSSTNLPKSNALMALFCFHSSRFNARITDRGEQVLYNDQDTSKWDQDLILKGEEYLHYSAKGAHFSKYHAESLIAYWHTRLSIKKEDKWRHILQLYNRLLQIEFTPIAALNRTYALAMVKGCKAAIEEAKKINLADHHLYHSLLAELYADHDRHKQINHLMQAVALAKTRRDKVELQKKLKDLI